MARKKSAGHYHHGALDRALVDAAIELTTSRGVESWGMSDAARHLGVSTGAPYRHFKNKTELLDAVARHGLVATRDSILRAVAKSDDPRAQLVAVTRGQVRLACRQPTLYRLTFSGVRRDTWKKLAGADPQSAFGTLRAVVERWQEAGLFRAGDPVATAILLWAHTHGLASLVATGRIEMSERRALALGEAHVLALLDGIGA